MAGREDLREWLLITSMILLLLTGLGIMARALITGNMETDVVLAGIAALGAVFTFLTKNKEKD